MRTNKAIIENILLQRDLPLTYQNFYRKFAISQGKAHQYNFLGDDLTYQKKNYVRVFYEKATPI